MNNTSTAFFGAIHILHLKPCGKRELRLFSDQMTRGAHAAF